MCDSNGACGIEFASTTCMQPVARLPQTTALFHILLAFLSFVVGGCTNIVNAPTEHPYKIQPLYSVDDPQFARTMGSLLGPALVGGNSVVTLVNGDRIFPAML